MSQTLHRAAPADIVRLGQPPDLPLSEYMEYICTFLLSMTPIGELRLSIPVGIETYGLPWYGVFPISVIGNLVPGLFWLLVLPRLGLLLASHPNPLGRLLEWRSAQLRRWNAQRFHRHGALALTLLVAVPLPMTGVWTGCLAAWAFEIPFRKALPPIALGALIAGAIVTGLTMLGIFVAD